MRSKDFILASSSAIRISILKKYSIPFKHIPPTCDENKLKADNLHLIPSDLSTFLAKEKALSISKDYTDSLVLGCDQICLFNNKIFEKPGTRENAIDTLKELRSNEHFLIGSYVFVKNGEVISTKMIETSMFMKDLTNQEINAYVDEDKPFNSCGSYMFEKNGYKLFKQTNGSLEAINGLPFNELKETINEYL
ncbi:Maf family nucleotide pyrophosphatase [Gammaproteobacteria bacterium]|nr:Maf family nucleotide pyrophosphatase [Gammaproteobacteria bacterium]